LLKYTGPVQMGSSVAVGDIQPVYALDALRHRSFDIWPMRRTTLQECQAEEEEHLVRVIGIINAGLGETWARGVGVEKGRWM
jgi:hypothetical protein